MGTSTVTSAGNSEQGGGGVVLPVAITAVKTGNSVSGFGAHAYWRIYVTATNGGGGGYILINNLQFWETLVSGDKSVGGTPIFDVQHTGGGFAANAFDLNGMSAWFTTDGSTPPHWLGYHFAEPVDIPIFKLTALMTANISLAGDSENYKSAPRNFNWEYSDNGTDWFTALAVVNETDWGLAEQRTYALSLGTVEGTIAKLPSVNIDSWRITAISGVTGKVDNSAVFSGDPSTYSLPYAKRGPHTVVIEPRIDTEWVANYDAQEGDIIVASDLEDFPFIFEVTTAGDFGVTEPVTYNTSQGATTTAGAATLTCLGPLVQPVSIGPILL
jgi:hypothetical protein